jgi:pimeloyl-ACP methyl ester carboxylesterase
MWLPHRDPGAATGTIVAAEGGPGYPSGESREGYRALFDPLLDKRDLLLMDDRGTGRSGAIDCEPLQHAPLMVLSDVTRCGQELGSRSDLYGSALAADDLAALMTAVRVKDATVYGDSYGTFFAQVFAARHPNRVRRIALDGAYPATGPDPWYSSTGPTIRSAFDLVCRRSPACAALPGTTNERLATLVRALRRPRAPIVPSDLALIAISAGLNSIAYRELDAAARAYLDSRDAVPLVRLAHETYAFEERGPSSPRMLSQGLFVADSCSDNPQAYDMRLPPAARQAAWQQALREKQRLQPDFYAPFTIPEFLGIPLDYSYVPLCQTWPVAALAHPAGRPIPPGTHMPAVPALVLTGDLDTITTPAEGDLAAALFPGSRRVIVRNTGHVTAIDDVDRCASKIVRAFVAGASFDASCAAQIPPVRLVPAFAIHVANVPAAAAVENGTRNDRDLRSAATAVYAAADALYRARTYDIHSGRGLRGGKFVAIDRGTKVSIALQDVRWTNDLVTSGTLTYDAGNDRADATLRFGNNAVVYAMWNARARSSFAHIAGTVYGQWLDATMPAP